jgi:hypothetical protein
MARAGFSKHRPQQFAMTPSAMSFRILIDEVSEGDLPITAERFAQIVVDGVVVCFKLLYKPNLFP